MSTTDQDPVLQLAALEAAGCGMFRAEKASDICRGGRTELRTLLGFLREGGALMVTRVDRLARSLKDLQDIAHEPEAKGVALRCTEQPADTGAAAGLCVGDVRHERVGSAGERVGRTRADPWRSTGLALGEEAELLEASDGKNGGRPWGTAANASAMNGSATP